MGKAEAAASGRKLSRRLRVAKRAGDDDDDGELVDSWGLSQISIPPGIDWSDPENGYVQDLDAESDFTYKYHASSGKGQFIYIVDDDFDRSHDVSITSAHLV